MKNLNKQQIEGVNGGRQVVFKPEPIQHLYPMPTPQPIYVVRS